MHHKPPSSTEPKLIVNGFNQLNESEADMPLMNFVGLEKSVSRAETNDVVMPLVVLAKSPNYQERWSDGLKVRVSSDVRGIECKVVETTDHLVIDFQCKDHDLSELNNSVQNVYKQAYHLAEQQGFKCLIRVWNYLDQINLLVNGEERYQTFCVARHQALDELKQLTQPNPAATAIGGHAGMNTFTFLFSKTPGQVIENNRQISAWQYPRQYAPKQPRFSRAMQYGGVLLCSGTASVLGHETIHLDNLVAQFDECMKNIQTLLDESAIGVPIEQGIYRFYLRDKTLLDLILDKLSVYKVNNYVVLEGDICRENLLIECEAVFQSV